MKAKELMCDDIVSHNGNFYKVSGVLGRADGVQIMPIHLRNSDGLLLGPIACFGRDIEPIPLTPEILEKNGFDYNGSAVVVTGRKCDGVYEKHFKYVHELQHSLRDCQLTDLADNFKV